MKHPLTDRYGLTVQELLDAVDARFRLRVAVEGAVAETQVERHIKTLIGSVIDRYEVHDEDGFHDFSIWIPGRESPLRVECKNVRNSNEAFRSNGTVVAYKVETQKTRASKGDPTSRLYNVDQFDILAVCLGKKTRDWTNVMFIRTLLLARQRKLRRKLAAIQRVPLPSAEDITPWFRDLASLLRSLGQDA